MQNTKIKCTDINLLAQNAGRHHMTQDTTEHNVYMKHNIQIFHKQTKL